MKLRFLLLIFLQLTFLLVAEPFPHETYIVSYAEAPLGRHPVGLSSRYYSLDECEKMARQEAENFTTGQIYGYSFEYQIENPITKRTEYFKLAVAVVEPIARAREKKKAEQAKVEPKRDVFK